MNSAVGRHGQVFVSKFVGSLKGSSSLHLVTCGVVFFYVFFEPTLGGQVYGSIALHGSKDVLGLQAFHQ